MLVWRAWLMWFALVLIQPATVPPPQQLYPLSRVRSTDTLLVDLVRRGVAQSATFRTIVERLEASDLIVYLNRGHCGRENAPGCLEPRVTIVPGARYVYILISEEVALRETDGGIVTAHELRHAVEIADAPWVRSAADFIRLYDQIGTSCGKSRTACYETADALAAGRQVAQELRNSVRSR